VQGLITSQHAARLYSLLSTSGPLPIAGLKKVWGDLKAEKAVWALVGAGYARRVRVAGEEIVALHSQGVDIRSVVLGWFALRLAEKGGVYDTAAGLARFPSGTVLPVEVYKDTVVVGDLVWDVEDLKEKNLIEGAKKASPT